MTLHDNFPLLNPVELRVLGSLIEKSRTTPDYYPMTLNGLTAACNQKTSRHPVTDYEESTVLQALNSLKAQSLVATAVGSGNRTLKYKHNFTTVFEMEPEEMALLGLLILRGPQTPGELNTNSTRLFEFKSLEHVHSVLNKLMQSETPFVRELAKRAGQKETRFMHLFGGDTEPEEIVSQEALHRPTTDLEARVLALENEVAELKESLAKLLGEDK